MPRDLADVLHYFLPELEQGRGDAPDHEVPSVQEAPVDLPGSSSSQGPGCAEDRAAARPPLPVLGLPIGARDVVRAALAWNLAIETTRLGASTVLLAPDSDGRSPLWPEAGIGPLGSELVYCRAQDLEQLYAAAAELAAARAEKARQGGIVFLRIPPEWLEEGRTELDPVRWMLLMSSSNRRDLDAAFERAARLVDRHPRIELGLTVHGAQSIAEARSAFEWLARRIQQRFGLDLISYGLLVDDLHVYRAIAAQRPIGLAHPQAPATRALMDVARLLYEDARSRVLG